MALSIRLYDKLIQKITQVCLLPCLAVYPHAFASTLKGEPVQACVLLPKQPLNASIREHYAKCLGWQVSPKASFCYGYYTPVVVKPLDNPEEVRILANQVSFYNEKRSLLKGKVEVQQDHRIVSANTAYVYRDASSKQIARIELLGNVHFLEPGKLMIANKAVINPQNESGQVEGVLYRFDSQRSEGLLPAWGRAELIERFSNKDYLLKKASYSNCAPQDKAWEIQADKITLNKADSTAVARNAVLRVQNIPVLYTPYITFPTSKERQSGFLSPVSGYSNIGGYDLALPLYLNLAPNYDATLIPHLYSLRGVMMGGEFRFLTPYSSGEFEGHFLPHDRAYRQFLSENAEQYPFLQDQSSNRWSVALHETTLFNSNLYSTINFQQISDDYFLQDFSTNLSVITERQLLRQADLVYTRGNWLFRAMAQSYQTLNPVNETPVSGIYERLPQLMAKGLYNNLPLNAVFSFLGEYDQFHWATHTPGPQGPRLHLNPVLSFPEMKPWGFFTPSVQLVENYYDVTPYDGIQKPTFNRTIPRFSLDSGLFFDRNFSLLGEPYMQTLEPRLFYLYVPYQDQARIPVYDSAYMIFNSDQLFRVNRFSGFDRIGDANQLAYALTSRWLSDETGAERASFSMGQIHYFSNRRVQLCHDNSGYCQDNTDSLGFVSSTSDSSPVASRAAYHFSPSWTVIGDYVWDPATRTTNNSNVNFHYQPGLNQIINFGYTFLVDGDTSGVANYGIDNSNLHQATLAYAWPLNERWSTLGAYSYNLSKGYNMLSFLGLQYDNCCWAMRLLGGQTFKSLDSSARPHYNTNVYLQILLKGLGSVENSDPYNTINTYIPGYNDQFHR